MSNPQEQSVYYVPGAILLAGFIIAGAIYFTNRDGSPTASNKPSTPAKTTTAGAPRAISADEHILGNPNANLKIVEFSDTECPFCKRHQTTMNSIIDTYGKAGTVAWVYRHFPLDSLHKKARKEAEATECANELGGNTSFWAMLNAIYTKTNGNDTLDPAQLPILAKGVGLDVTKFNTCLASGKYASKVEADYQDGLSAGARGTPYNIIVLNTAMNKTAETTLTNFITQNGMGEFITISSDKKRVTLNGALPEEALKAIIDALIK